MKKIILIPAAAGVLAFGGIVLANTNPNTDASPAATESQETNTVPAAHEKQVSNELIGFEKAAAIALAIADGKVTDVELSEDDGRKEYEVEVHTAEYEYDFDIDAYTGEVLEQDRERLRDGDRSAARQDVKTENGKKSTQPGNEQNVSSQNGLISAEQAKDIALRESGGGTIVEFELDNDDGRQYYEIEIVNGQTEYELEIDAAYGSITEFELDDDDDDDDNR
ncbi:PepSY domain-containing protein [Planococcus sp. CAU13]|uniref:PepSY domain-containing protein n=1 Tax=Planococcus sp. CAU13 TaxID=1541197 RepID=UPI000691055A|nr:PepSY domain-containing protein [Planococcus sp. CAU13]